MKRLIDPVTEILTNPKVSISAGSGAAFHTEILAYIGLVWNGYVTPFISAASTLIGFFVLIVVFLTNVLKLISQYKEHIKNKKTE